MSGKAKTKMVALRLTDAMDGEIDRACKTLSESGSHVSKGESIRRAIAAYLRDYETGGAGPVRYVSVRELIEREVTPAPDAAEAGETEGDVVT